MHFLFHTHLSHHFGFKIPRQVSQDQSRQNTSIIFPPAEDTDIVFRDRVEETGALVSPFEDKTRYVEPSGDQVRGQLQIHVRSKNLEPTILVYES